MAAYSGINLFATSPEGLIVTSTVLRGVNSSVRAGLTFQELEAVGALGALQSLLAMQAQYAKTGRKVDLTDRIKSAEEKVNLLSNNLAASGSSLEQAAEKKVSIEKNEYGEYEVKMLTKNVNWLLDRLRRNKEFNKVEVEE